MKMCIYYVIFLVVVLHYSRSSPPNIVVFLTDDQDVELGGMDFMPKTKQLLMDRGTRFKNAFVSTPICCPSRASILTGRYLHNHRVVNNSISGGCSSRRWQTGPETMTIATYLKDANYTTVYAGKYMNQYGHRLVGGVKHVPQGWDSWLGLVGNSVYYNYTLSENGRPRRHGHNYPDDYLTNVITNHAISFLLNYTRDSGPFFMMLATPAPHSPFTPATPYRDAFPDLQAPRTPAYNIHVNNNKHWMLRLQPNPLPKSVLSKVDEVYRNRLRTLLSVDDMVERVIRMLHQKDILEDTYVIYTSDHGYHLGEFSVSVDKRQLYEFDIRVPLIVRGPGVPVGKEDLYPVVSIDLAPTILDIAGLQIPTIMDGKSFHDRISETQHTSDMNRVFLIEYHGEADTGIDASCRSRYPRSGLSHCYEMYGCKCQDAANNTYNCIRGLLSEDSFIYCLFTDNENFEEVYNLVVDPFQLNNLHKNLTSSRRTFYKTQLKKLMKCRGASCRSLHL